MSDAGSRCSYSQHGKLSWKCPYPVFDDNSGLCIFHTHKNSVDMEIFYSYLEPLIDAAIHQEGIRKVKYNNQQKVYYEIALKHAGRFCGFVFSDGVSFREYTFNKADFSYAKFLGQVQFWNVKFIDPAKFHHAQFNCDMVSFDSVQFDAGLNFAGSSFNTSEGVFFHNINCCGKEASYRGANFSGSYVSLDDVNIDTDIVDFAHMKVECNGTFQISGRVNATELISFERSSFVSPIYLFSKAC